MAQESPGVHDHERKEILPLNFQMRKYAFGNILNISLSTEVPSSLNITYTTYKCFHLRCEIYAYNTMDKCEVYTRT